MEITSVIGKNRIDWDDFLEQATEDISTYLWALETWRKPPQEFERDYLLLSAFCSRARGRVARDQVKRHIPPQDEIYRLKLEKMWQHGEDLLNEETPEDHDQMAGVVNHQFVLRLERLQKELGKIRRMHEDSVFHADDKLYEEALYDACQDFFMEFRDLFLACEEISKGLLPDSTDSNGFERAMKRLDRDFQQNFDYFYPIAHLLPSIRCREYHIDRWWLKRTPSRDAIQMETVSDELLNIFAHANPAKAPPVADECPMSEQAIHYVFGELSVSERKTFWDHLLVCPSCVDLVLDLRIAEDESSTSQGALVERPVWLSGNLTAASEESFLDAVKNSIPNLAGLPLELVAPDDYLMRIAAGRREKPTTDKPKLKMNSAYQLPLTWSRRKGGQYRLLGPEANQPAFMKFYEIIESGIDKGFFYWAGLVEKEDGKTDFLSPEKIQKLPCHTITDKTCRRVFVFVALNGDVLQEVQKFYEQKSVKDFLRCLKERDLVTIAYEKPEEKA